MSMISGPNYRVNLKKWGKKVTFLKHPVCGQNCYFFYISINDKKADDLGFLKWGLNRL